MKIEYTILWVDDSPGWVEPVKDAINDYLDEQGFRLVVILLTRGDGIDDIISSEEIDLIIMDQKLPGTTGADLITQIRSQDNKYTDIIYYSQDPKVNLEGLSGGNDGIYRTTRENAEDTIKHVVDTTIKKTQDINNMRGLVIAETLDIEAQIENIITKYFKDYGKLIQEKVLRKEGVYDFGKKIELLNKIVKIVITTCNELIPNEEDKEKQGYLLSKKQELERCKSISSRLDREVMYLETFLHT